MPCKQDPFFSLLLPVIHLARELRDSDAHETSAVVDLAEKLHEIGFHMSAKDAATYYIGDKPQELYILEGMSGDDFGSRERTAVHLSAEGSERLTVGVTLLWCVCHLSGPAPSGTVQDAIGMLTDVVNEHKRRCRNETADAGTVLARREIANAPFSEVMRGCTCPMCKARMARELTPDRTAAVGQR